MYFLPVALALVAPAADKSLRVDVAPDGSLLELDDSAAKQSSAKNATFHLSKEAAKFFGNNAEHMTESLNEQIVTVTAVVTDKDLLACSDRADNGDHNSYLGTGFVISCDDKYKAADASRGMLVAAPAHLVQDADDVKVTFADGTEFAGQVVKFGLDFDVALIGINLAGEEDKATLNAKLEKCRNLELASKDELKSTEDQFFAFGKTSESSKDKSNGAAKPSGISEVDGKTDGPVSIGSFTVIDTNLKGNERRMKPSMSGAPALNQDMKVIGFLFTQEATGGGGTGGIEDLASVSEAPSDTYLIMAQRVNFLKSALDLSLGKEKKEEGFQSFMEKCSSNVAAMTYSVPQLLAHTEPVTPAIVEYTKCGSASSALLEDSGASMKKGEVPGVLVWDVAPRSILAKAEPPIGDMAMLMTIDGKEITPDGKVESKCCGAVHFHDYMFLNLEHVGDTVEVTSCQQGKKTTSTVTFADSTGESTCSLRSQQPGKDSLEFETIGGLVIQPLTAELAVTFLESQSAPTVIDFLMNPEACGKGVLVVTKTEAADTSGVDGQIGYDGLIGPGTMLKRVNGVEVHTLDELRAAMDRKDDALKLFQKGESDDDIAVRMHFRSGAVLAYTNSELKEKTSKSECKKGKWGKAFLALATGGSSLLETEQTASSLLETQVKAKRVKAKEEMRGGLEGKITATINKVFEQVDNDRIAERSRVGAHNPPVPVERREVNRGGRVRDYARSIGGWDTGARGLGDV